MRRLAALLVVMLAADVARGADRFDGMDAYVREAMAKWEVPGVAIAVVKDGAVVLERGWGVVERGTARPVAADTRFPIASVAKSFVAAVVAALVEDGKLAWDDPVVRRLPDFDVGDPWLTARLTLRDLLCHRTGLQRGDLLADDPALSRGDRLRRLRHLPAAAEPRTRLTYSNLMFDVLAEVVERTAGRPFEQFVAERFLTPLKMTATTFGAPADQLALRHWRCDAGVVARPADRGMHATAGDLARWLAAHLGEPPRVLRPETLGEMHALQFSVPVTRRPADNIYAARFHGTGLGWFVQEYRGRKVVLHGGGWGAMAAMLPEERLGVAVLTNLDLESLPGMLMYDVFDACLVGPATAWDRGKWATWLRNEPPGHAYRPRDAARAKLAESRRPGVAATRAPADCAGDYLSDLYGRLRVRAAEGGLAVEFGGHVTALTHWEGDAYHARTPTRLTFDWLITFGGPAGGATTATVKHVGWDADERDHVYRR